MEERFFDQISPEQQQRSREFVDSLTKDQLQRKTEKAEAEIRRQMDAIQEAEDRREFARRQKVKIR